MSGRLKFRLRSQGGGTEKEEKEEEEKEEKEKVSHTCESIGHRPLRVRCPKGGFIVLDSQLLSKCITEHNSFVGKI